MSIKNANIKAHKWHIQIYKGKKVAKTSVTVCASLHGFLLEIASVSTAFVT